MKKQKPTVIDMFCGCGGLSQGFMETGFEVPLGVDNNEDALTSFTANHGKTIAIGGYLFQCSTIPQTASLTEGKQIDLFIGVLLAKASH